MTRGFVQVPPGTLLTQDAVAILFAKQYKGQLAFCHDRGAWLEFDGSIWRQSRTHIAFHYARELARHLGASDRSAIAALGKVAFAAGVETFAQRDPVFARNSEHWDQDPWLLGTPAGTVDLRSGNVRPASSVDGITKSTHVPPALWAECPIWLEFLRVATAGDEDLIRFLQQMCGYSLTGDIREHALFFIYGPGGNGKSVFLSVLTEIIAMYAKTAAMETFERSDKSQIPADLAMLDGARLVTSSETEEGRPWAEARIKKITGGDEVTARFMRQNFFSYKPQFKIAIVGNHKPVLRTADEAMRRRFNLIPFTVRPPVKDVELIDKLRLEYPSILRWMIEGCLDWQKNGLIRPLVVVEATDEYFAEQNLLAQWVEEFCEADHKNPYLTEKSSTLFASWNSYLKRSGEPGDTNKSFSQRLEMAGFVKKRNVNGAMFVGIELKRQNHEDN